MLDTAFEALKQFDWGSELAALNPIEDAAIAAYSKPEVGKDLENRLIASLQSALSLDAQEYVCRKLAMVGTAAAVPSLAVLLVKNENSHMARYALERIPAPEAGHALRDALPNVAGLVKIGIVSSLGARRDQAAVAAIAALLIDGDSAIARAAALALGEIGSTESATALQLAQKVASDTLPTLVDALLRCAEVLLASNKLAEAGTIYKSYSDASQPRLVRLAAARGLLACASKVA